MQYCFPRYAEALWRICIKNTTRVAVFGDLQILFNQSQAL